jgi:hypothetical protein
VERCVQRCQLKLTPATRLLQFPREVDKGNDGISSSTIFGPAARLSFGIMPFSDDEAIRYLGRDAYDQFINYNYRVSGRIEKERSRTLKSVCQPYPLPEYKLLEV